MKTAAYARYSTDKQTDNSIATQMDGIIKFCQSNGYDITATYVDEAQTGTNTNRKGFMDLLEGARAKKFEAVVIYDISRGSRDVADWFNFRKEMQAHNITVLSATEKLGDISNPNDFLVELINVGLGQHMVLQTRQKSMAGVAQKAKEGQFLGGVPPLGYDVVEGEYVINSAEADIVRSIFNMYAAGASYDKILEKHKGYRGKRGRPIGKNSIKFILNNERYVGVYSWNKQKVKSLKHLVGVPP